MRFRFLRAVVLLVAGSGLAVAPWPTHSFQPQQWQKRACTIRIRPARLQPPPPRCIKVGLRPQITPAAGTTLDATGEASSSLSSSSPSEGTATIPNEIFNLVKSIVGAGVLSLPAGVAAYGDAPSALIPATLLICLMGAISAYTFSMLARVCQQTGALSYADAWDKTRKRNSWLIAASSALDCFAGNLTYSIVLADTFRDLLLALGITATRSHALLGLTGSVLLPLCLVKNLSSLAPFSLLGIVGMAYTSIAIGIRYFGGSYATGGKFIGDLAVKPSFGSIGMAGAASPKSLILICMLSTAYIAHFNAPKFYKELKNNTIRRFNLMTISSFGISVALYAAITAMGFLTFGSSTVGLVLNNYSTKDILMSLSRFAVALSLVFSYPLLFVGTREGVLDLFKIPNASNKTQNAVSLGLLGIITTLALKVKDITFVSSMSGAVLGTSLIFIYPTLMFRNAIGALGDEATVGQQLERKLAGAIAVLGVAVGGVGAKMALQTIG